MHWRRSLENHQQQSHALPQTQMHERIHSYRSAPPCIKTILGKHLYITPKNRFSNVFIYFLLYITFSFLLSSITPLFFSFYLYTALIFSSPPHPSLQQCQSLRRADVSSRCWCRLAGDREGRGLLRASVSSPPLQLILPDIFLFGWIPLASVASHSLLILRPPLLLAKLYLYLCAH